MAHSVFGLALAMSRRKFGRDMMPYVRVSKVELR